MTKPRECAHCQGSFVSSPTPRHCATCYQAAVGSHGCALCGGLITTSSCAGRKGKIVWDGSSESSPRRLSGIAQDLELRVVEHVTTEALNCAVLRWTERDLNVNGPCEGCESRDPFTGKPREQSDAD